MLEELSCVKWAWLTRRNKILPVDQCDLCKCVNQYPIAIIDIVPRLVELRHQKLWLMKYKSLHLWWAWKGLQWSQRIIDVAEAYTKRQCRRCTYVNAFTHLCITFQPTILAQQWRRWYPHHRPLSSWPFAMRTNRRLSVAPLGKISSWICGASNVPAWYSG